MSRTQALVLAGHGSQYHPDSSAPLHAHADRVRATGRFDEVRTVFWKEEPALGEVRSIVESDVDYVVPVLTSEGYFADEVFPRELGVARAEDSSTREDGTSSGPDSPEVRYAEPVGTHEALASVIEDRVESAIDGSPADVGIALVGHGTERHERSARSTVEHVRGLRERDRYSEVEALFLDEDPHVGDLYDRLDAAELVVVPLFVADGHHTTEDVPEAIGHPGVGETATVAGRLVHYAGAVGTEPSLAEVIVERAVEAGATVDVNSSGGGRTSAARAFLRHVEETATETEWGQLSIATRPDGYELRHVDDIDDPRGALETLQRPVDLRERARTDRHGQYRPLSGAKTLPTGWTLPGLGPESLVSAVRFVYPGSIAHWWSERSGTLDVTHFRESVARQTGLYADLDGFGGAALDAAAESVCGDCVRRRRWEAGPDEEIDASCGEGAIPCREACPFFLSAAHAFHTADDVDADGASGDDVTADDDVTTAEPLDPGVPAATFEVPGNRYRVRFARALARRADAGPVAVPPGGDG